jgi:two-component system, LuxR family, response regulator FixJ
VQNSLEVRRPAGANVMEKMQARSVAHLVKMHLTLNGETLTSG